MQPVLTTRSLRCSTNKRVAPFFYSVERVTAFIFRVGESPGMLTDALSPHRSHRADFHAAGSSGATPLPVPRMCDPWEQQWVATEDLGISLPRQPHLASSATEPLPPGATNFPIELHDAFVVRRSSVVLVVAPELGVKGLLLFLHRIVAVLPAPVGNRLQAPS